MGSGTAPTPSAAAAAREAGNDDVEDGDDAVDDGFQDGADAVDDCHQTGSNGLEDGFDLLRRGKQMLACARK